VTLTVEEARSVIAEVPTEFAEDDLFGQERGDALEGVIASIYQGLAGRLLVCRLLAPSKSDY